MSIKVVGPRILVKPEKLEDTDPVYKAAHKAGLVVHKQGDVLREEQAVGQGIVLQVTEQCYQPPVGDGTAWCKVGDFISFAKYAGRYQVDPEDGVNYLILNDEDVVAILTRKESE